MRYEPLDPEHPDYERLSEIKDDIVQTFDEAVNAAFASKGQYGLPDILADMLITKGYYRANHAETRPIALVTRVDQEYLTRYYEVVCCDTLVQAQEHVERIQNDVQLLDAQAVFASIWKKKPHG